ncbi:hypothetical protein SETIT_8G107400v2 [Setaria italica]|uniref:Thioredoxin-like protein 4B n=1 Tax=Setaria italica TaxID=4555 RepID=A0A368S6M2_SETIT|nr:hypothetical protein SETIT_8G107400v2 [Setaria italica]
MGSALLPTLRQKREVDAAIRDTLDKVLVLRFGRAADAACLHLDDILAKSSWDISKFASVALVDMDSEEIQVYIDYFDITLVPATIFFFNAHHMKMDSGTPDHTKWIGSFSSKQDFIDVVETNLIYLCYSIYGSITSLKSSYRNYSIACREWRNNIGQPCLLGTTQIIQEAMQQLH